MKISRINRALGNREVACMEEENGVVYEITGGKVMQAIICDDEISTCGEMEQILREFAFENSIKLETEVFYDGNTMMQYLKRETVPAILFWILNCGDERCGNWKVYSGGLRNSEMFLVYISSKKEYALELFQNQPFDFLVKPIKKEKLWHVMEKNPAFSFMSVWYLCRQV